MKTIQLLSLTLEEFEGLIRAILESSQTDPKEENSFPTLITRSETARILGVSHVTIEKWSKQGHLKKYRLGGRVYFKREEVIHSLTQAKDLKYKR